jgi:hypothetical protein
VQPARDQLLAGSALARDEHGRVDRCHLHDALEHLHHRLRLADDAGRRAQAAALDQPPCEQHDLLDVDGLRQALRQASTATRVWQRVLR